MDQNNSRDQNFAPSFRNDSHISSRNEHRTATPYFKMTVIYHFKTRSGLLLISKRQSFVISKGSSYSFERIDIYHIERKIGAVISIGHSFIISKGLLTFNLLWDSFFQPTVLCVIRLVSLLLVRITHKTAGTPEAQKMPFYD